ncbi:MAG: hypothetical protein NT062_31000 [Proteobacteria bacterium]|nr:hypothetical protein [Pseudomonadota bacterium]
MNHFSVRVQLHHEKDYEPFHSLMESVNFDHTITCSMGVVYNLPRGEYVYSTNLNLNLSCVHGLVAKVCKAVRQPDAKVLVTVGPSMWSGLTVNIPLRSTGTR